MADNNINQQELAEERRRRQMAIIKASNQMLKEAKEKALKQNEDPLKRSELEEQFNRALDENRLKAERFLHATSDEVERSTFRDADQIEVQKYNERLKKLGVTDEEMHRKDSATVTIGKNGETTVKKYRRKRRGAKKDLGDDYQKLDNEEELMRQSMVTSDEQIAKNIEKNEEIHNTMIRERNDVFQKMLKPVEEEKDGKKINMENVMQSERVELNNSADKKDNTKSLKNEVSEVKEAKVKEMVKKSKKDKEVLTYDFDFSNIPSYVQYDVIPLPSKGQCYPKTSPLRCGRIPVAYLTASDENIIASPNVYRDGKLFDIILKRKVLDKRINVEELCSGDRDAIILWLRGTSYGEELPINATNPETGKRYSITISLSQFDYNEFDLEGDDDGLFDFETDKGDIIKFRFFTPNDEERIRKTITSQVTDINKFDTIKALNEITRSLGNLEFSDEERNMLNEDIDEIKDIVGTDFEDMDEDVYPNTITEQMIMHTVSVNGNKDREFIKNYIENMRTKNALEYRNTIVNNVPGVDFNFTVNIPESDGGGSFNTFLRLDDTIFIYF